MEYLQKKNPYTLQFSMVPPQYICRIALAEEMFSDITKEVPAFRGHFITGVRGSGKTAMMTDISNRIAKEEDWITADIADPESNILDSLARALYRIPELRTLFVSCKLDFSVLGIGFSVEKAEMMATNETDAVELMLIALKKKGKKLLVTIDEVTYGKQIAAFSHAMSSFARKGYGIYVIMTGLSNNIREIKDQKSLTFLYRAKEEELQPLNKAGIIGDYMKVFGIGREKAAEMAELTRGYAFAFQVLGYLYWKALSENREAEIADIITDYDCYLSDFAYGKIWSETTRREREILKAIAQSGGTAPVAAIRENCRIGSADFSVYREHLIEKGIVNGSERGILSFTLPRFSEFVKNLWE